MSNLMGRERVVEILLVEGSPGDVRLTRRLTWESLESDRPKNHSSVVRNGAEATSYLRRVKSIENSWSSTVRLPSK
jgi:hypothetical protein